jgi:hypothetical protein
MKSASTGRAVASVTAISILVTLGIAYRSQFNSTEEGEAVNLFNPAKNTMKGTVAEPERRVHLIALGFSGQQAAGVNAFSSFQCWAAHSGQPFEIVEPIIKNSRLVSPFQAASDALKLSDFFALKHLNNASKLAGLPRVITLQQFLDIGSKDVIFIQFEEKSAEDKVIWSSGSDVDTCYVAKTSKKQLDRIIRRGYCIRKIVSMKSESLTTLKLYEVLGNWNYVSVTVVVSNWRGPMSPHAECKHVGRHSAKPQFYPSPRLLSDASSYIRSYYAKNVPYNAVMIRIERVTILAEQFPGKYSVKGCLTELVNVVDSMAGGRPMVAADIGNYGSSSWDWAVSDYDRQATGMVETKVAMQSLLRGQLSFEEWEQAFVQAAGGVTDRGYIAALQRTIASRAKCLVLMGGGNFQYLALLEYLRVREKRCVHLVCVFNEEEMKRRISVS